MKWFIRGLGLVAAISLAVSALVIGAALIFGTPFDHAVISIDDADFTLGDLNPGHWLLAFAGVALACAIVMVVVPLAVLVPLAFGAVAIGLSFAFTAALFALLGSPLILLGWLIWRLTRRRDNATPPGTTIAA